ncbi:hypothetical protein EV207_11134 [Scopulibacillus darangshiensis]|uniref:N-acetyltransferase domain-containing protein n=1 Tax=Scopulibacillus darangshiensis TaxID=442528 RepID=A0A4R2P566_9BACL|nr:GNAT family N-acetyltransferase [Scopulibacillus darangshiensis]TCP29234.1 hypothetical protein EV207_11134 [Scopulibacillus darangshiensis]
MSLLSQCKIVQSLPRYMVIEELSKSFGIREFYLLIDDLCEMRDKQNIAAVSIELDDKWANEKAAVVRLEEAGLTVQSVRKSFERGLKAWKGASEQAKKLGLKSLNNLSEHTFCSAWQKTMEGSLNAPGSFSVKDGLFEGLKEELGESYKDSCLTAFLGDDCIGVAVPHIEPGTRDEGRLFYFGILPEFRSEGLGNLLHERSLDTLKALGAATYIGTTDAANEPMQRIFEKNGCRYTYEKTTYKWQRRDNNGSKII